MSGKKLCKNIHFTKVNIITSGGAERYLSVGRALQLIADGRLKVPNEHGYVFIHGWSQTFSDREDIRRYLCSGRAISGLCGGGTEQGYGKESGDGEGFALSTPDRRTVWNIQYTAGI